MSLLICVTVGLESITVVAEPEIGRVSVRRFRSSPNDPLGRQQIYFREANRDVSADVARTFDLVEAYANEALESGLPAAPGENEETWGDL